LSLRSKSGFTLIELVVVVFLIALLSSVTLPRVSNLLGVNLKSGASEVAGYLRHAYEQAALRHERIRVRFDLERGTYWAEAYVEPKPIPLLDENSKIDEAINRFEDMEEELSLSEEEKLAAEQKRYEKLEGGTLKPAKLPRQIKFKGVYTAGEEKEVDQGSPWIEFSPGGYVPKTIVKVMNDNEDIYSIVVPPLGGRPKVERGDVRPSDV